MRLISLCPSNTELLAYLGLTPLIVGVDDFSDWPQNELNDIPRLGPDLSIRMDDVEALNPDLVLASLSVPGMEKIVEQLVERQIPHVVYNPHSLAHIRDNFIDLGARTNRQVEAERLIETYDQLIERYEQISKQLPPKKIYWEWWPQPVFSPGRNNWLTEISRLAGGMNIYHHDERSSVKTDWNDVYEHNPDHICLAWVGIAKDKMKRELLDKRPNWQSLAALKENRVHIMEEALYCRPSPRLIHGLVKLASLLHPEAYPQYDGHDPLLHK